MATRSSSARRLRSTPTKESPRLRSGSSAARNAGSAGSNRRLPAKKSPTKASSPASRQRPVETTTEEVKGKRKRRAVVVEKEERSSDSDGEHESPSDRRRERARVEVDDDAAFLRVVEAAWDRMETAPRRMPVWNELAGDRFANGFGAKGRFQWLLAVADDPDHLEFGNITSEMKQLLKAIAEKRDRAAKAREKGEEEKESESPSPKKKPRVEETEPAKDRRKAVGDKGKEAGPTKEAPTTLKAGEKEKVVLIEPANEGAPTRKAGEDEKVTSKVVVDKPVSQQSTRANVASDEAVESKFKHPKAHEWDIPLEESLMQLVVDHGERFISGEKKNVWEDVAKATKGRYVTGENMRNHARWVVRSMQNPKHYLSKNATPRLRELVRKFKAIFAAQKASGERKRPSTRAVVQVTPPKAAAVSSQRIESVEMDEQLVRLIEEQKIQWDEEDMERWDEIAAAVRVLNPSITSGIQARGRLSWLLAVHGDPRHLEHPKLSSSLREQLTRLISEERSMPRNEAIPGANPLIKDNMQGVTALEPAEEDDMDDEEVEHANESEGNNGLDDSNKQADGTQPRKRPGSALVDRRRDELLMRLVLQLRPFEAERVNRGTVWAKIVDELRHPKITNGLAAHSRVRWLLNIYQHSSHSEHSSLSDDLRRMLDEYQGIDDSARAEGLARVLSINLDVEDDDEEDQSRADPGNELLLREVLRFRPFHAKLGSGMTVWKQVASSVNRAAGVKIYPTGQSCLSQMKRLLAVARATDKKNEIYLSKKQRAMTGFVDALLKIHWPKGRTELTDEHLACLDKIQRFLDGQPAPAISARSTSAPRASPRSESLPRREQMRIQFTYDRPVPAPNANPIDRLRQDILNFRETAAKDRTSRETIVSALKEEVAACRAQLMDQIDKCDDERRERRQEIRTVMELLTSERSMHARESAMVMQAVQKEREDRRQEFSTLINLVSRAVLGHSQPLTDT